MKRARVAKQQTTPSKYKKTSKKAPLVMYKTPKDPIRLYKRTSDYFSLPISGATGALGAYTFQLSNIPNSSEFTSLYDQYKINAVSVCFYPKQTHVTSLSTTDNVRANARILTAVDYNDDTPCFPVTIWCFPVTIIGGLSSNGSAPSSSSPSSSSRTWVELHISC